MKYIVFIFFSCLVLSSCATIFSKKNCYVQVNSNIPNSKIKINDSIYSIPAKISLTRSKKKLALVLFNDSISKKFILKPSVSPKFIFGNLSFIDFFPLAYGIDFLSPKRYYYRKKIDLNSFTKDSIIRTNLEVNLNKFGSFLTKEYPTKKGQFKFNFSHASLNFLKFKPENERIQTDFTVLSLKLGVDYFYKKKTFVAVDFKALTTGFVFGESFDPYERTFINRFAFSLSNNNLYNRFSIGYGANYAINSWKKQFVNYEPSQRTITKNSYSFGAKCNVYYQLNSLMFVGLNYENSFFQINPVSKLTSNENIYFDLILKIKNRKNKNK